MRGGRESGKGSPAFTGQVILLFCRMRRRAHITGRSQDHLRVNGVEKRRVLWKFGDHPRYKKCGAF